MKKIFKGTINGKEYTDFNEFQKDFTAIQDTLNYSVSTQWSEIPDCDDESTEEPKMEKKEVKRLNNDLIEYLTDEYLVRVSDEQKRIESTITGLEDIPDKMERLSDLLSQRVKSFKYESFDECPNSLYTIENWLDAQIKRCENVLDLTCAKKDSLECDLSAIESEIDNSRTFAMDKINACIRGSWAGSHRSYKSVAALEQDYEECLKDWASTSLKVEIILRLSDYYKQLSDTISTSK